ncbi:MAG: hypothetical protein ACREJU_19980 [Nitrospiraceae bacterium]
MMTSLRIFLLSLSIGSLVGVIPLLLTVRRDPFDALSSYVIWLLGFFFASLIIAFYQPGQARRCAFCVGAGLALAGYFLIETDSSNLWPLSLIFSAFVGMPPAFAGAHLGKVLSGHAEEWAGKSNRP